MNPQVHEEHDFNPADEPGHTGAEIVSTSDPMIEGSRPWEVEPVSPDRTIVAETSRVGEATPAQMHLANPATVQGQDVESRASKSSNPSPDASAEKSQANSRGDLNRSRWLSMALTGLVALVCGVGGAWAFSHFEGGKKAEQANSAKKNSANSQDNQKSDEGKSLDDKNPSGPMVSKAEFDGLKQEFDGISGQLKTLSDRFDSFNGLRNETVRDIGTMQVQVKEMSHSMDELRDVPKQMQPVQAQINRLQEVVNALSYQSATKPAPREVASVVPPGETKGADSSSSVVSPPILANPIIPADPTIPNATMASAVSFFKKGRYIDAEEVLKDLRTSQANDARVWYWSALAHGLVTNQWDGETLRYVMDGAAREQKGSPSSREIDAEFADLTPIQGKDWLAAYRARLVKH